MSELVGAAATAGILGREELVIGGQRWEQLLLAQGTQGMTGQEKQQLNNDLRQSVRKELDAARVQVEAARAAHEAARAGLPAPPAPPAPELVTIDPDGNTIRIRTDHAKPGMAGQPDPFPFQPKIPEEAVIISIAFFVMLAFIAVGWPLARAFARRIDRQPARGDANAFPTDVSDRIERIEHAVEAIAIEVERVSEGQRYTTKLLSEMRPDAVAAASASAVTPSDRRP